MDLDLNEEQELLRATIKRICSATFDSQKVRALEAADDKLNRDFWKELGANGLCGLRVSEAYGGAGMGALDMVLVFEEFGRVLASSPFLSSSILSANLLSSLGSVAAMQDWLPKIASGEVIIIPAWQENDVDGTLTTTSIDQVRGVVNGEKLVVPFASVADMFLVQAIGDDGACWALVSATAKGVSIAAQSNYASQPLFAVRFDNVMIDPSQIFPDPDHADAGSPAFGDALLAVAAEAVGAADRLLALTSDYANQRNQFGRPIAAFQAVSHPLAECATELEGARYLVYQAAWAKDEKLPCDHLARMAKLQATSVFRRLATVSVQVHGGIGYSSEGEPQLYYRRSKYQELMYATASDLKARISDHVFA